jgi:hypothetical protein
MIKIRYLTVINLLLHFLPCATLIILEYMCFLLYLVFLALKADGSSVMSSFI